MPYMLLEPAAAISEQDLLCFQSYPLFFLPAVLNECLMNSPNLLVSVPPSHPVKTCVGFFGSVKGCGNGMLLQTYHSSQAEGQLSLTKW